MINQAELIHFNVPPFVGDELSYVKKAVENHKICGDGEFTLKCSKWMEEKFSVGKVLLTTSGTTAIEMAAFLCNFKEVYEVILPSYTFSSTATAFVLAGVKLVFIDIRPDTMNMDEMDEKNRVFGHSGGGWDYKSVNSIADDVSSYVPDDAMAVGYSIPFVYCMIGKKPQL